MENLEIAHLLSQYADLLEIQGADRFRIRAYRNAARTIESLPRPIVQLLKEGKDLKKLKLPGIGERMTEHIDEIVKSGTLSPLKQLQKKIPGAVHELLEIEGLGPKRTKLLYQKLGVSSIKQLEEAIVAGKVASLTGFGQKSVGKIRQALQRLAKRPKRFKLLDAEQLVRPLIGHLEQGGKIEQLEVAGSYRRRTETVGDIDILAVTDQAKAVMQRFLSFPEVEHVIAAGSTRGTVTLGSGLQIDLRILPRRSYGAALHYFTGSKAHNIAVRTLAAERGLRINEYGIFRVPTGKKPEQVGIEEGERLGGLKEEEVFHAVNMAWVPPELRENRGEIQAAQQRALPTLITTEDIQGDLHLHSKWTDGNGTIIEMVRACKEHGYRYCAITDHTKALRVAGGLSADAFKRQREEIEAVRAKVPGIKVFTGCEVDILPDGSLDLPDAILETLDVVIAAVHLKMDMGKSEMSKRVLKALANPAVRILAHPTGRLINRREPFLIDLEQIFHAAKEHNVAIEVNAQPDRLDLNDLHIFRAREVGVKIAINTDSHSAAQMSFIQYGVDQARRGWIEKHHVLNAMTAPQIQSWLKGRQKFNQAAATH